MVSNTLDLVEVMAVLELFSTDCTRNEDERWQMIRRLEQEISTLEANLTKSNQSIPRARVTRLSLDGQVRTLETELCKLLTANTKLGSENNIWRKAVTELSQKTYGRAFEPGVIFLPCWVSGTF